MQFFYNQCNLHKRLLCVICIITFLFLCIIGKLFVVQIIQGRSLQTRAISQWTRDLPIAGLRGKILDRNGTVLASSYTSYDVYLRASNITEPERVAEILADKLGLEYEYVLENAQKRGVSETRIARQVDRERAVQIIECGLDGVFLSETSTRLYPYSDALCNVLGITNIDNSGQAGLEAYYDNFLTGTDGKTLTESTITGLELSKATTSFVPGVAGCDITLTIDMGIQRVLEDVTYRALNEQKAKGVTAIVMDPNNGEILGMATRPSFDLNNPPRDEVEKLIEYSKNVNIVDVYEPGSTFKLFTISTALSEGVTTVDEQFFDPGFRIVDGEKIKCWRTKGHGSETLAEGLSNSCNSVFMDLGLRLGKDKLYEYLTRFGFGSATGVDFFSESAGILMDKNLVKNVDLARISFGQAVAVTPLQMITGVCSVVNGTLYRPHFLKSIEKDGATKEWGGMAVRQVLDKSISSTVTKLMEGVVSTKGLYSFVPGYRIGGKTGTAQKYENGHIASGKYVSSFVGCYPVENPQYVLLLCVDEPGTGVYYGSMVASPYAKQIFSGIFTYLNIAPTNLVSDLKILEPNISVPNLVGMSIADAVAKLREVKLEYEIGGDGDYVVWQNVPAGEMLFAGGIIFLGTEEKVE